MKTPIILFRNNPDNKYEDHIASKYFNVEYLRTRCKEKLVIGRYSVLPHYRELENDLAQLGSTLINNYEQHFWIANFEYHNILQQHAPKTWFDCNFYQAPEGQYVVKGKTNSLKQRWNKLMFAPTKRKAVEIASELMNDSLIGPQGVIYREYIPLETYEYGLYDIPYTNEWRFFYYKNNLLSYGYYWSCADKTDYQVDPQAVFLAQTLANIVSKYVNFFVLDLAKTLNGKWILIEINDGQMSGPSENNLDTLYRNLVDFL